eukprot:TRINITY_DN13925_c0_g1_i3.p1 TRINITY_DN13925_c0_g1~~TRINITY_DN13925_c0_g1_i3.p1  ORF type:complete len:311 (-),score=128.16 TRINITY_DN13925_c0_g1_i3:286-1218(-)
MATPQAQVGALLRQEKSDQMYVSFEFFPPRTEAGDKSLLNNIAEFKKQDPIFVDFTWGAGGSTSEKTCDLCKITKDEHGLNVNMHLTCTNMPSGKVDDALAFCKKNDIRNIVALRGDPPAGQEWQASKDGFECALDLVKYIRLHHGDYFSIAVAGYPEGHPNVIGGEGKCTDEGLKAEYDYLKAKIDAGAECIITQLFYDVDIFLAFVKRCRDMGITCPILPGMLPMVSYAGLQRMVSLCKTYMPDSVKAKVEELKEDEVAFKQYGIDLCAEMCQIMMKNGINHFHFYTLNQTHSTFEVLKKLGLFKQQA